jgi:adenine-specific DNA-methyltransferase
LLPGNPQSPIRKPQWQEWEIPFDTDTDWPKLLQEALQNYRSAWRAKMDEVNQCIAANAEMEELVDKPEEAPGVVRVSGPFTVEGVIAVEDGPDTPIGGTPNLLETFTPGAANASASISAAADVQNVEAHLDKVIRLLKASGVDFPGNKNMKFSRLEPITGASLIHAEGEWMNGDQKQRRVAVTIGPDVGNITAYQVEDVIRDANRKGYDDVVFAAFGFDAAAQDAIEGGSHPKVRMHMALIRPDVAMGDLLKTQPGSQLFTVFSAPRIKGPEKQSDGMYTIEVEGMDVYDPVSNTLFPTDKERIAAWWLDSDYDGRTFCICQAFFPDKSKWDKLARALSDKGVIDEDAFNPLSGLKSLPFPRPVRLKKGEKWRVAAKVIDPRGNEGMRVVEMA